MEQKNQKKNVNETAKENSKTSNDSLNSSSSALFETYKKQMDVAFGLYNDMIHFFINAGKNNWGVNQSFMDAFTNERKNSFSLPFPWMKLDTAAISPFITSYENFIKELVDYNQNWFSNFQNYFRSKQKDWISLSEQYQDLVSEQLEAMKTVSDTLNDAYNRQQDLSADINKKLVAEFDNQAAKIKKATEEFWSNISRTYEMASRGDFGQKTKKESLHPAEMQ